MWLPSSIWMLRRTRDLWNLVRELGGRLLSEDGVDGLNVGVNIGRAAGQTVDHAHVHVIPRQTGDLADPRGGVRWVLPNRAAWWDASG